MKKLMSLLAAAALGLSLTSCAMTAPVNATSNAVGSKVGQAETKQIIGFFFDGGDASIKEAAKNAGITKISTVDFKTKMVVGPFVMSYTTIVTGE